MKKIKIEKGRELLRETEEQQEDLWSANQGFLKSQRKSNLVPICCWIWKKDSAYANAKAEVVSKYFCSAFGKSQMMYT